MDTIISKTVNKLIELNLTISTVESITGGLLASYITSINGSSKIFQKGFITYSNDAKIDILKIKNETINKFGVISKEIALEMSKQLFKLTQSDICVSITGNASLINPIENKATGLSYIGIIFFGQEQLYSFKSYAEDRNEIRLECVLFIFEKIWSLIKGLKK